MSEYKWSEYRPGLDAELDKIVKRRFGRDHEWPCNNPNVLTCAQPECQYANACQEPYLSGVVGRGKET